MTHDSCLTVALLVTACTTSTQTNDATNPPSSSTSQDGTTTSAQAAETTTTNPPASDTGECTLTLSGDIEESWTFPQTVLSFSSDHWLTEEEQRQVVATLGEEIAGGTYEEIIGRGEPVVNFFAFGCTDPDDPLLGAVAFATNATVADQIPMGPGSHPISGGILDADGPAGTMIADFGLSDVIFRTVADSGSVEITQWDGTGLQGSFSFDASETFVDTLRTIHVEGVFDYGCSKVYGLC